MLWNVFRNEVIAKRDDVFCYSRKIGRLVKNSYFYMQFFFSFLNFEVLFLPACRRLLFPLLHAEKGPFPRFMYDRGKKGEKRYREFSSVKITPLSKL